MNAVVWGMVLRMGQALLQGAPFIVTGLCVAGILDRLMGHAATRRMFGSNSLVSLLQSWLIGMLLPGCSLGVIPICRRLRASGISTGTIFAFALSSPLFDPLSLLYGLTLSRPFTILAFATCSLVVVTVSGAALDRMFPDSGAERPDDPPCPAGIKRVLAVAVSMARETTGPSAGLVACGLVGVGVLAALLPVGSLQTAMAHENRWSPLLMTAIALPAYATPMTAMGQLGSMFQHGNSVGAAFVLLAFGAGMNLGLVAWMAWNYGWRRLVVWFALLFAVVIAISYGIERPLYPSGIEPADHTHAFDRYCAPFESGVEPPRGYPGEVVHRLAVDTQPHEWFGASILALLVVVGVALRRLDPARRVDAWLTASPGASATGLRYDVVLPGPVVAVLVFAVIVAMSVAGCFAYYPAPHQALQELSQATTEVASAAVAGDRAHALEWIPVCEGWNRRLVVGTYLRRWAVSDYHLAKSRLLEERLEELEHAAEDAAETDLRDAALAASRAFLRVSRAWTTEALD